MITLSPSCGYGDAACQYLAGLDALGLPVSWTPVRFNSTTTLDNAPSFSQLDSALEQQLSRLWERPIACDTLLVDVPPPATHAAWLAMEPRLRPFAYAAHEVDRLPDGWAAALNRFERVFVPSRFNRDVFVANGVTVPVDVVPHVARGVEPVLEDGKWGIVADDDFVFYTVGEWTVRKAMEETLRAYLDAFDASEKVALVIKTDSVDRIALMSISKGGVAPCHVATTWWSVARIISEYTKPAKVHLIGEKVPAREIDRLHTRGDCFVSLTHSEGWGLVPFDALLFGNPVIITSSGGQLDYLGSDYPLAIRYERVSTANTPHDGNHLRSSHATWANADARHAGELMRSVFEEPHRARAVARETGAQLRARFAPAAVCRQLAELMGFSIEQ
jgi:glycosyltransferase involved in cell wall biosynthesis